MMILRFSIGNGQKNIFENLSFFTKSEKCSEKFQKTTKRVQNIKQGDPALRVRERKPGWRFTARLRSGTAMTRRLEVSPTGRVTRRAGILPF